MSRTFIGCVCMAWALVGCAGAPSGASSQGVEPGVYRLSDGQRIQPEELYGALSGARWVVVGESHDDAWHHQAQGLIYEGVAARRAGPVALGMEMFQRPFQGPLDAYVAGSIDEAAMLEQTEYAERWGFDVEMYAPLWRGAAARGARVVALNAPRELSRAVAQKGLDGLSDAERAQVPAEMDLSSREHRAWMKGIFGQHGHGMDEATFERFYSAQVLWDETMAQTAWESMQGRGAGEAMVVLAGSGHVMNGWGIPSRLRRRAGEDAQVATVVLVTPGRGMAGGDGEVVDEGTLARWRAEGYADYVWIKPRAK